MSDDSTPTAAAEPFDFTATLGMLSLAVGGTALAGGAFPIVMVAADAAGNLATGSSRPAADAVAIIILGGMVGFMVALVVGFLLALVAWLCSLPAGTVWFESLVYSTLWLAVAIQSSLIALWYFWCARRPRRRAKVESFT